jgi:serine/threonine protein kinase
MSWNELIGHKLEHYEILAELGRGGSSRVYKAFDTREQRDVAIKVIPNDAEDRLTFVKRFEREVEAVLKLHHHNIVAVYGSGETNDLVYLAMQCVSGGTLRRRLKDQMPMRDAVAYIIQMALALHHAHDQGIIHRDVKPSNMLLDAEHPEHLLLTDFGIAKIQGARQLTKSGTTIGTPEYMAPEQAEGREIDSRADIYALGCVLYEALAGRPPFTGVTPVSVLYQQVHSRPAYIRGFNPQVPRELARILEITLAKHPEDRFPTAADFATALEPFLSSELEGAILPGRAPAAPTPASDLAALSPMPPQLQQLPAVSGPLWPDAPPIEEQETIPPPGGISLAQAQQNGTQPAATDDGPTMGETSAARKRRQTVPLPSFRLPAKTRNLSDVLPPDSWRDESALAARFSASPSGFRAARTAPDVAASQHPSPPRGVIPTPYGPLNQAVAQDARWDDEGPRRDDKRRGGGVQPMRVGIAVASCLLVLLISWIAVSASGLTLQRNAQPTATVRSTALATATPQPSPTVSATATSTPKPTATTDPQRRLNALAATYFRAVTLATFNDGSCSGGNSRTHFSSGQLVYVNLCAAGGKGSTTMTVTIRRGGRVVRTMTSGFAIAPGAHYYFYTSSSNLGSGTFDLVVTVAVQGGQGVARDIRFTVG